LFFCNLKWKIVNAARILILSVGWSSNDVNVDVASTASACSTSTMRQKWIVFKINSLISSNSVTSLLKSVSISRSSTRFCAPWTVRFEIHSFTKKNYILGFASLYIDTALWAFRRTDGSLSLNNCAKRGMTLHPSIACRPIAWPL